jgi:glutathione S-transferase
MKLFYSPTSPYVRKVMVVAKETGQVDKLELETVAASPIAPVDALNAENPLGKVPCLVTDDGNAVFDSRYICEYLDCLHDGAKLIPTDGADRWRVQRIHAMCDGVLDAGILCLYEKRLRPEDMAFQPWIDAQMLKINRAVAALADDMAGAGGKVDMASIAAGITLGYLDFRFSDLGWRDKHPALKEFYDAFSQRPAMQETVPADP